MVLLATDILSPEGVASGGALLVLGGGLKWLLGWWQDRITKNAELAAKEHKEHRTEAHEDEDREDNRWKSYSDRLQDVLTQRDAQYEKLRQEIHDQANRFNERLLDVTNKLLKAEGRILVSESRIKFLEQILDDAKVPHPKWDPTGHDSSPFLALPPTPSGG